MGTLSTSAVVVPSRGLRVRRERGARGWTQAEVADLCGVGQQALSAIETGRERPWPKIRRSLAELYGVSETELFEDLAPLGEPVPLHGLAKRARRR